MTAGANPVDVSVIIATWKAEDFIERAIKSVFASTGVTVEVVAVDDASPDGTMARLRSLAAADPRIIIDQLPENSGPSIARNRALDLSSGRYVSILDADDAILPERLASLVAHADKTGADIVLDNMKEVDAAGQPLHAGNFLKDPEFKDAREIDLRTWIHFNQPLGDTECLGYLKPLIRRTKLDATGVRYDAVLRNSEDYYLLARMLAGGARMTYVPEPGYLYTRAAGSISHRLKPANTRALLDGEKRFQADYRHVFSASEAAALAHRERGLRNLNQFVSVVEAAKTRKIGAFVGLMASDVRASAFTLGTLAKIAAGKVLRRKMV
jgi:succinoglycan biosynthesis protein ExoO